MAIDRFITWNSARKAPKFKELKAVLEDYLSGAAVKVDEDGQRIYAILQGKPSFPFKRIPTYERDGAYQEQHDERWIEVYWSVGSIDVITRMTDEYTNGVAEGFATLVARFWKGKRSES